MGTGEKFSSSERVNPSGNRVLEGEIPWAVIVGNDEWDITVGDTLVITVEVTEVSTVGDAIGVTVEEVCTGA